MSKKKFDYRELPWNDYSIYAKRYHDRFDTYDRTYGRYGKVSAFPLQFPKKVAPRWNVALGQDWLSLETKSMIDGVRRGRISVLDAEKKYWSDYRRALERRASEVEDEVRVRNADNHPWNWIPPKNLMKTKKKLAYSSKK